MLCRQRCVAAGFKPLQSRALYVLALPRRWLARDSFPAFGKAKVASAFRRPGLQTRQSRSEIGATNTTSNPAPVALHSVRLGAGGKVVLCRQRCAAVGFKPLQSRALYVSALPQRWLARDSFPAFGEAKVASAPNRPGCRGCGGSLRGAMHSTTHNVRRVPMHHALCTIHASLGSWPFPSALGPKKAAPTGGFAVECMRVAT